MPQEFKCNLCTPDGIFFDAPATSVNAPGLLGEFSVLAKHAPMVAILKQGVLLIQTQQKKHYFAIESGSFEVDSQHNVMILTDKALEALDVADANQKVVTLKSSS